MEQEPEYTACCSFCGRSMQVNRKPAPKQRYKCRRCQDDDQIDCRAEYLRAKDIAKAF